MTEIKLLDYAAKAAGLGRTGFGNDGFGYYPDGTQDFAPWNPLNDDGDALRLAVKLQMDLVIFKVWAKAKWDGGNWIRIDETQTGSVEAATRRAIVLVAAEIGRSMP